MSSAVMEMERVAEPAKLQARNLMLEPKVVEKKTADPHPLLPVFIAGAISLTLAVTFVGSILTWIALRHSGIMAP